MCNFFVYFTFLWPQDSAGILNNVLERRRARTVFNIRKSIWDPIGLFKAPKRLQFTANTLLAHTSFPFIFFLFLPSFLPFYLLSFLSSFPTSFFRFLYFLCYSGSIDLFGSCFSTWHLIPVEICKSSGLFFPLPFVFSFLLYVRRHVLMRFNICEPLSMRVYIQVLTV